MYSDQIKKKELIMYQVKSRKQLELEQSIVILRNLMPLYTPTNTCNPSSDFVETLRACGVDPDIFLKINQIRMGSREQKINCCKVESMVTTYNHKNIQESKSARETVKRKIKYSDEIQSDDKRMKS